MSLGRKLQQFLHSPKGQRAVGRARQELSKPENQRKLKSFLSRLGSKRRY